MSLDADPDGAADEVRNAGRGTGLMVVGAFLRPGLTSLSVRTAAGAQVALVSGRRLAVPEATSGQPLRASGHRSSPCGSPGTR